MIGNFRAHDNSPAMHRIAIMLLISAIAAAAQTAAPSFRAQWKILAVDSVQSGDGSPAGAIDGDPMTYWHTHWYGSAPPHPHEIAVDMGRNVEIAGFTYLPRQAKGGGQPNGRIDRYEFLLSKDATNWTQAARGRFPESGHWFTNRFQSAATARYFKLVSWSAFKDQPFAAVGELDVLVGDKNADLRKIP